MQRRGFHTITLGCKLNQFDAAAIEGELARRGMTHESDPAQASVVIVNTCTVTHRADSDARKIIRSVRRRNPDCKLLVTGCYATSEPETLRALGGVDRVFGNPEKPRLAAILDELGIATQPAEPGGPLTLVDESRRSDRGCEETLGLPRALFFGEKSRAFLRVQEGCRLRCAYCIIPRVRGHSRSVPPGDVVGAARSLIDAGYSEIVLTGVNTGDYGRDLHPATDLAALLRALLATCGTTRIRLNSLEPLTVTDAIVELLAGDPRLAPHLQIPLQAGNDTMLRGMRRNYGVETYRRKLEQLHTAVPDIGLGADVIVGFPGETDRLFDETCEFIDRSPLSYLHVFSWSPRPGTPAASFPDRVAPVEIRERSRRLRALGSKMSERFRKRFEGRALDAIALGPRADGKVRALTGNFIEVLLKPGAARPREPILVRIDRVDGSETHAQPEGIPEWARSEGSGSAA